MGKFKSFSLSYPKENRDVNEDSFYQSDFPPLYAVADGIGSYKGGDIASDIATSVFPPVILRLDPESSEEVAYLLKIGVQEVARALYHRGRKERKYSSMATTLTGLYFSHGCYHLAFIGDSRAYLWRQGELTLLSRDHTLAFEQYQEGSLTREEIADHPNQKLHTRSLTARKKFALPEIEQGEYCQGDIFFLATDGLLEEWNEKRLISLLERDSTLEEKSQILAEDLQETTLKDDTTVLFIEVTSTNSTPYLYHILSQQEWEEIRNKGVYESSSLKGEGFIHCCRRDQITKTGQQFFSGRQDLMIMAIDPQKVEPEIRWEDSEGTGELFPHIYGTLSLRAVIDAVSFPPGPQGEFPLPDHLPTLGEDPKE